MIMGPGTRLGRYEIITHLASGGMASVYLARAIGAAGFQRLVAIKRMHGHIAGNEQFVTMFLDEARLAARIRHPNVVPTLDLENGDDGLYLAMEFVEGDSFLGLLKAAAKRGEPVPPSVVLRVMIDTLHGLDAAHELKDDLGHPLNLVHRDVSPHNILVGTDGVSRITDFGVARAEERVSTTKDGQLKGKLSYMAPETTTGEAFDRRADIFSAAIVLWEALTSRRLFKGANDLDLLRQISIAPIPHLRDIDPNMPRSLETVLVKALERDPSVRYATAGEFADDLESAGAAIGIAGPRAVATYVKSVSAERVVELAETVRSWTEGQGKKRLVVVEPPAAEPVKASPSDVSVRDAAYAVTEAPAEPRSAKRAVAIAVVAAGLVVLGAILAVVTLNVAKPAASPVASASTIKSSPAAAAPSAAPTIDAPVTDWSELPKSGGQQQGGTRGLPRVAPRTGASASSAPSAVASTVGAPTAPASVAAPPATATSAPTPPPANTKPANNTFNPEAM